MLFYGLKQYSRAWFGKFTKTIHEFGMTCSRVVEMNPLCFIDIIYHTQFFYERAKHIDADEKILSEDIVTTL